MKFLGIYKAAETGVPPTAEHMAAMGQLIQEMTEKGLLLSTEGCLPSALGVRVRRENGKITVTDGPFTETKELIAGFALMRCDSKEEAIAWTKKFLEIAGDGESEVRQVYEPDDSAADASTLQRAHALR